VSSFGQIDQFHPSTSLGDAITNDMLEIRRVLRESGFSSEIFSHHVAPGLEKHVRLLSDYVPEPASLLLIHHSMGFDGFDEIAALPCRKILRYHNITPSRLLPNPHLQRYAEIGRRQLREYAKHVEIGVGVSEFNRKELVQLGYRYTSTVPLFIRAEALLSDKPDPQLQRKLAGTENLLFVGRICPNKKQDDLVRIFDKYRQSRPNARLLLPGSWEGTEEYTRHVRSEIRNRNLDDVVWLPGKISAAELAACYRSSSALLCASEHEGFCAPLLEAMAFDLPVVAFNAAAVPETLGEAGILLDTKDPEIWSEVIAELRESGGFRDSVLQAQRSRLPEFHVGRIRIRLLGLVSGLCNGQVLTSKPVLQIQGPFETSYSLAVINRNLALALDDEGSFDVSIHCTEGPGDYVPKSIDLADKPRASWLWQKAGMLSQEPDVVIRNLYPPRVCDMSGQLRLLYFFWEDSLIRKEWAQMFNSYLDGVLAPSRHVEQVLRESGVTVPVVLLHAGIDEEFFKPRKSVARRRPFQFLHISSGFPRKGIDVLLAAFFREFTQADNVVLILKTFPNIHNDVADQLARWQAEVPNGPNCVHMDTDLDQESLAQLYEEADCAVYPSRAEGFGLPMAEAMAKCIPLITTAYGGQIDFCSPDNSFLLEYRLEASGSHLNVPGAQWASPDVDQLRSYMRFVVQNRKSKSVTERVERAFEKIQNEYRWSIAAEQISKLWTGLAQPEQRQARVAMVTSWDSRCGIAEYTRYLLNAVLPRAPELDIDILSSPGQGIWQQKPAAAQVCWTGVDDDLEELRREIRAGGFDAVHFQFNFGFFGLDSFAVFLRELKACGTRVLITFHATADSSLNGRPISLRQISSILQEVDLIFVHSKVDQRRLGEMGVSDNVMVIHHGTITFPEENRAIRSALGINFQPVIGTFGFLLPHKGILELLRALCILRGEFPNIGLLGQCALHHDPISREFEKNVRHTISDLNLDNNVLLSTEFLSPEEAVLLLQMADVIALPYGKTRESSSAAVRFAIAAGRPIITTEQEIFSDVRSITYQIPDNDPHRLAEGIRAVITDDNLSERLSESVRLFSREASWPRVAETYIAQLRQLLHKRFEAV
jgi:glycosyltransferase involved in cell wall biosynthesis